MTSKIKNVLAGVGLLAMGAVVMAATIGGQGGGQAGGSATNAVTKINDQTNAEHWTVISTNGLTVSVAPSSGGSKSTNNVILPWAGPVRSGLLTSNDHSRFANKLDQTNGLGVNLGLSGTTTNQRVEVFGDFVLWDTGSLTINGGSSFNGPTVMNDSAVVAGGLTVESGAITFSPGSANKTLWAGNSSGAGSWIKLPLTNDYFSNVDFLNMAQDDIPYWDVATRTFKNKQFSGGVATNAIANNNGTGTNTTLFGLTTVSGGQSNTTWLTVAGAFTNLSDATFAGMLRVVSNLTTLGTNIAAYGRFTEGAQVGWILSAVDTAGNLVYVNPASIAATNAIGNNSGNGTNTTFYGTTTVNATLSVPALATFGNQVDFNGQVNFLDTATFVQSISFTADVTTTANLNVTGPAIFSKATQKVPVAVTGTIIDATLGDFFIKTADANVSMTVSNLADGQEVHFIFTNGASYTVSWPQFNSTNFNSAIGVPVATTNGLSHYVFKRNGTYTNAFFVGKELQQLYGSGLGAATNGFSVTQFAMTNTASQAGIVTAPGAVNDKVWKTGPAGESPAWRDDANSGGGGSDATKLAQTNGVSWGTNVFNGTQFYKDTNAVHVLKHIWQQFEMDSVNGAKVPWQFGYCIFQNQSGTVSNYVVFYGVNPNLDGNKPVAGQPSWYHVVEYHYSPDAGDDFIEEYWRDENDKRQMMMVYNKNTPALSSTSLMGAIFYKDANAATEIMSIDPTNFRINMPAALWVKGHNSTQFGYTRWYNANNDRYLQIGADNGSSVDHYIQAGAEEGGHIFNQRIAFSLTNYLGLGAVGVVPGVKLFRGHTSDNQGTNTMSFSVGGFNGGITNLIPGVIYTQTATAGPTNTTTATQLLNGNGHTNFPPNFFTAGRTLRIVQGGQYSTAATPGTYGFVIQMGTVTLVTNNLAMPASLSNMGWDLNATITFRTVGASGTAMCDGYVNINTNGNTFIRLPLKGTTVDTTSTIDTTAAQNISVRAQTSVTTAPAQIRCSTGKIYLE
jgi:hypothetical protein